MKKNAAKIGESALKEKFLIQKSVSIQISKGLILNFWKSEKKVLNPTESGEKFFEFLGKYYKELNLKRLVLTSLLTHIKVIENG